MTGLVLATGAGAGLGLWLLLAGWLPRPPSLAAALKALEPPPAEHRLTATAAEPPPAVPEGWAARLGTPAVRVLTRCGLPTDRTRQDLATVGKPAEAHLAERVTCGLAGLLLPGLLAGLLTTAGTPPGVTVPAAASLGLGAAGLAIPELLLRAQSARHRAAFRHALGSFLDLVVISLAGGAGVDQALDDAAAVGGGPAYTELRHALAEARLAQVPPWETLAELGRRAGVTELQQLAATVGLAGSEGAKVRASLRSRALALRTRQLTDAEADASAATERMSLPIVALFAGFLIFLGYPAITVVLSGL